MRSRLIVSLLLLSVSAVRCSCGESPDPVAPTEGEGEGESAEGEGEGEGEGENPPGACLAVVVGDNLPAATGPRLVELLTPRGGGDRVVVLDADDALPADCGAGSRALVFGHSAISVQVLDDGAVGDLDPEGYLIEGGTITSGAVDWQVLATDGVPSSPTLPNGRPNHLPSPGGAAYGSYALLEELGFAFMHPLEPTMPTALPATWPALSTSSAPRWHKRNMHLHTMHPLELTDLLNGWGITTDTTIGYENLDSWNAMRPEWSLFLEWMIANGQNEVEWILLEADSWTEFAHSEERARRLSLLVDDCHDWGVACGVDVPIALQQQHTFRLISEQGDRASEFAQIRDRLAYLMDCGFDFLSTENGSTEFTNPGSALMLEWIDEVARVVDEVYEKESLIKIHVSVGQTAEPCGRHTEPFNFNFLPTCADERMGVMPHTVQMYGLTDPAPTYSNENNGDGTFGHIREFLQEEVGRRQVVWHPETAYWVSVDIDVPLFLPLYAERRVADLQLLADDEDLGLMGREEHAGKHMDGQSIFSSGWEWGYWLNDVVAARAAWDPFHGETTSAGAMRQILKPFARSMGLGGEAVVDEIVSLALKQHREWIYGEVNGQAPTDIIRRTGFAYMAGFEAFDDLADLGTEFGLHVNVTQPGKLGLVEMRNPNHDPPSFTGEIDLLLQQLLSTQTRTSERLRGVIIDGPGLPLYEEILDSADITKLRAAQVLGLYSYVDQLNFGNAEIRDTAIAAARSALDDAAAIVARREQHYRVPADRIAGWHENPTAYDFTYLWTVRSLYFWWRDEGKAVEQPISPCYLNIINPADVALGEGGLNNVARLIRDLTDGGFLESIGECAGAPSDEPTFPQNGIRD
ncbi:MAG TPA: hypothetical protein VGF99_13805 [Myxococcota bacterium]